MTKTRKIEEKLKKKITWKDYDYYYFLSICSYRKSDTR